MRTRLAFRFAWCSSLASIAVACGGTSMPEIDGGPPPMDAGPDASVAPDAGVDASYDAGPPRAIFSLPRDPATHPFFDLPWPNDVRRQTDGRLDMTGFPNPRNVDLVNRFTAAISGRLTGFATNGAVYLRVSRALDPASLPASPSASLDASAAVFLMDVDASSPDRGTRHPIAWHYQDAGTRFWAPGTLAVRPVYGVPLASERRYALVLTRDVRTLGGETLERDPDFDALVTGGGDGAVEAARAVYGDVFDVLDAEGVTRDRLLSVAVFTTQDAIGELIEIRDWMIANYPLPVVRDVALVRETAGFFELTGSYGPVPVFQSGTIPYASEGGAIELESDGTPTVQSEYDAQFTLTLPKIAPPPEGYPLVLYAHGTGGDRNSFVEDGTALLLAGEGFAVMGVDQIHHGARNPSSTSPSLLFFNIANPDAARDNTRQSALDVVQQARVAPALTVPPSVLTIMGAEVRIDATRLYFMGHSQGGLNGPLYLAIDDSARGGVLSAASAVLTNALVEKLEPVPIPELVRAALNLPGGSWQAAFRREGFTVEHPIPTLVQTWIEVSDASNYAHLIFASPRPGFAPKSVLMTEGMLDTYSPPASIEALAGSMLVPQIEPVSSVVDALAVRGIASGAPPATGNVAGGLATGGLLQYPADGHFAIFDNRTARDQVAGFFQSLYPRSSIGTIPAP